jgi:hypothetical protein
MPFVKGQIANPNGYSSADRAAVTKIRTGIDRAIDKMKHGKTVGIVAFQEKLAESFENQFLATLKAVAPFLPKDVFIESSTGKTAQSLTDDELADIVATRARLKRQNSIEAECTIIEDKTALYPDLDSPTANIGRDKAKGI